MSIGPHRTTGDGATGHRDDARAKELNNLRLALATFALQLDAFEMRTRKQLFRTGTAAGMPIWPPDVGYRLQRENLLTSDGKNDWSIKSHGNKPAE
jgi:hypothetical protein